MTSTAAAKTASDSPPSTPQRRRQDTKDLHTLCAQSVSHSLDEECMTFVHLETKLETLALSLKGSVRSKEDEVTSCVRCKGFGGSIVLLFVREATRAKIT